MISQHGAKATLYDDSTPGKHVPNKATKTELFGTLTERADLLKIKLMFSKGYLCRTRESPAQNDFPYSPRPWSHHERYVSFQMKTVVIKHTQFRLRHLDF